MGGGSPLGGCLRYSGLGELAPPGATTYSPMPLDVHLRLFAETAIGHGLSDGQVIEIVTKVAEAVGVKAYMLDRRICKA